MIFARMAGEAPVGAVVLAAGRSSRMGATNKLLAELGGRTVIARTVDALAAAGLPPPVIVLGHDADKVKEAIGGRTAIFVFAPDHASGISRSIAAGISALPLEWKAALIALGDMAEILPETLAAIAEAAAAHAAVVPICQGCRGNPVAWGRDLWPRLVTLGGDRGARDLLASVDTIEVVTNDAGILFDVDTSEALAAARKRVQGSSSV